MNHDFHDLNFHIYPKQMWVLLHFNFFINVFQILTNSCSVVINGHAPHMLSLCAQMKDIGSNLSVKCENTSFTILTINHFFYLINNVEYPMVFFKKCAN